MSKGELINILMKRDDMSEREASDLVAECADALLSGDEEAIQSYLGLEDDYLFDVLDLGGQYAC